MKYNPLIATLELIAHKKKRRNRLVLHHYVNLSKISPFLSKRSFKFSVRHIPVEVQKP